MSARVEWLTVRGPVEPWQRLGLVMTDDGLIPLFGPGIRVAGDVGDAGEGLAGWALSGIAPGTTEIDGLPTEVVAPADPVLCEHPLGAIGLDHVVVATDDLERTSTALAAVTGAELKRVREAGAMLQGFHRLGSLVVELVQPARRPPGEPVRPAFWGLVLDVEDLDAAVDRLGPDLISPAKRAVQPGRSIATVRTEAGLGLPVALMSR